MSATAVPPPPPPEQPPVQPPLPVESDEQPPLPTGPPPPADETQHHLYQQQAQYYQVPAANAAYPYAQQPMYQYPLQQPYSQAYTPYNAYQPYGAWPASAPVYGNAPAYNSYQPHAAYPAPQQPITYAPSQQTWPNAPAASTNSAPVASLPGAPGSGGISFSLNGSSLPGQTVQAPPALPIPTNSEKQQSPQALKDWIRRALQKHEARSSDPVLKETMKQILEQKKAEGALYTHDWDREPLPVLPPLPSSAVSRPATPPAARGVYPETRDSSPHSYNRPAYTSQKFDRGPRPSEASLTIKKSKKKSKQARDRTSRFAAPQMPAPTNTEAVWNPSIIIKGTCQSIEKSFLRLNGVPKPEEVRPEAVLVQALDRIINMIAGGEKDFMYIWSQLKAIRQDLTVQHIRNATTVRTEETFARSALEHADQQEFRKCVSTLQAMYDDGIPGCHAEFGAYQLLLYVCIEQKNRSLSFSRAIVQLVSQGIWHSPEVQHAMAVFRALSSSNYALYWELYASAPNCGRMVMDWGVRKMRYEAVKGLAGSCRTAPRDTCMQVLGFAQQDRASIEERARPLPGCRTVQCIGAEDATSSFQELSRKCCECLQAHGGTVTHGENGAWVFEAKASSLNLVLPKQEQKAARVGNTHLDCAAFLKDVPTDRNGLLR